MAVATGYTVMRMRVCCLHAVFGEDAYMVTCVHLTFISKRLTLTSIC